MKKKNVLTLVLALVLVAALAVGGTLAYFTDNDAEQNVFTMGHVDINLDESQDGGTSWEETGLRYEKVLPGDTKDKMARVTVLDGSADCYVMVNVAINNAEGSTLSDAHIAALYDAVKAEIDAAKWDVKALDDGTLQCVYLGSGNHIAHANDVLILFEQITIPGESFKNDTANQTFTIDLNAYAIQSDNVDYADTIWGGSFETYVAPVAEE